MFSRLRNKETPPLFVEFSLRLSRACLGKIMHDIYKWRKRGVSLPDIVDGERGAVASVPRTDRLHYYWVEHETLHECQIGALSRHLHIGRHYNRGTDLVHPSCQEAPPAENASFSAFPCVCPEPVWVN
jgi:hypothetical protein